MEIVYIIYLLFYFMKNSPPPLSKKKSHKTCEFAYMYYAFKFFFKQIINLDKINFVELLTD